jgi:cell division septal protein FtsQ
MRRDLVILLSTVLIGISWSQWPRLRHGMAEMSTFQVERVDVQGLRFVQRDEVIALLDLDARSSVWTDPSVWAERVAAHPLVEHVDVARRLPDGLRITVTERRPVALAPTPTLEPVDAEGHRLPLDPAEHRLDLPVLATTRAPAPGAKLFPENVRELAGEIGRLMAADTAFSQLVSEVGWSADGTLRARWSEPAVDFLLQPGVPAFRLRQGLDALADAAARTPADLPDVIDLRFADQVVVRRTQPR